MQKYDFCACCVLIILCLLCVHKWAFAPSLSSRLGLSNAVFRSKIRQKLVAVVPFKVTQVVRGTNTVSAVRTLVVLKIQIKIQKRVFVG